MIDFNLDNKEPKGIVLKAYLYQAVNSIFSSAFDVTHYLDQNYGGHDANVINTMKEDEIQDVLSKSHIDPKYIYYFKQPKNQVERNFLEFPELFTDIWQVSFDCDGLIIMQSFCSQTFSLFNSKGDGLIYYCHDLDLGTHGLILFRTKVTPIWELQSYDGEKLHLINTYGPFNPPADFPHIGDRDVIKEMFSDGQFPEPFNNQLCPLSNEEVIHELIRNKSSFRYLQEYYKENKQLATYAVKSNIYAFSLLSKQLQEDREFVIDLINKDGEFQQIYPFLSEQLKSDMEIAKACFISNPGIVKKFAPISDKELLKEFLTKGVDYLEYASDDLKTDREFILEIVKIDWHALNNISLKILTDREFVLKAIKSYNEKIKGQEDGKIEKPLDLKMLVEYFIESRIDFHVMKLIAPILDLKLFCKGLDCMYVREEDMEEVLDYAADELKASQQFWLETVNRNLYVLKHAPEEYRNDHEVALSAVLYHWELIEFLSDRLKYDPEIFMEAIKQVSQRKGKCEPNLIFQLLPVRLRDDNTFFNEVVAFSTAIFNYKSAGLKNDDGMLKSLKIIYSFIVTFTSVELSSDPQSVLDSLLSNNLNDNDDLPF